MGLPGELRKLAGNAPPPLLLGPEACWGRNASTGKASNTRTLFLSMRAARGGHDRECDRGPAETSYPVECLPWRLRQTLRCAILWPAGHSRNSATVATVHQSRPTSTCGGDPAES